MSSYHTMEGNFRSIRDIGESSHLSTSTISLNISPDNMGSLCSCLERRFNSVHKCVSSKAALLTLFWLFIVSMASGLPNTIIDDQFILYAYRDPYSIITYSILKIPLCLFPLAGFLADNKFGRYKVIITSLFILLIALIVSGALLWTSYLLQEYTSLQDLILGVEILVTLCVVLMIVGVIGFNANALPFGMDQLHDSPGDHQSLFIHWYVWAWYLGVFAFRIVTQMRLSLLLRVFVPILAFLSIISLCLTCRRRRWFLIDTARLNPYKLVYKVTRFS